MSGTGNLSDSLLEHLPLPLFHRAAPGDPWRPVNARARAMADTRGGLGLEAAIGALLESAWRWEDAAGEWRVPGADPAAARLAQQLESYGRYTGGIVHNLNNPLNALSGMIQLMMFRNMDIPELERLDRQADELAALIRHLGDRYRRLLEYDGAMPLTWELVIQEELRFYRADSVLKHRCELVLDLPADRLCPLPYREASWLVDRLLEALLALVPGEGQAELCIDLPDGWPRLRLRAPDQTRADKARDRLALPLLLDLLAQTGRRLDWSLDAGVAVAATEPLDR